MTSKDPHLAGAHPVSATILGMPTATFTTVHVVISFAGIASGIIVLIGMLVSSPLPSWTALFLATTVLTSATGYFFHTEKLMPSQILGGISLALLALAILALYVFGMAGAWRWIYVVAAVTSLYLNVFVLVVQSFLKVPALHKLAPKGNEPPFAIAQGVVLVLFVALGFFAVRSFHPEESTQPGVGRVATVAPTLA